MGDLKPEISPETEEEEPLKIPSYMVPIASVMDRFLMDHFLGKHGVGKLFRRWKRDRVSSCDGT